MSPRERNESSSGQRSRPRTGAWLIRYALEQLPVRWTFGIPGVHNTELYDELARSERIEPVLVTHEMGAAWIADAISRTGDGDIGTLAIVPAAGVTHALSGICEAYLAGVPLLVVTGGIRTDLPYRYQIHEIDAHRLLAGVTKQTWKVTDHADIVPTLFEAYRVAISGLPGPVLVEVPVNVQLFKGAVGHLPGFEPFEPESELQDLNDTLDAAVDALVSSRHPGLFLGWGAVDCTDDTVAIAELLGAPVSTTLQGLSAFPGQHALHAGMGFGPSAVPAARSAFGDCDCLLAVGTRFAEIPTGSFGCRVPESLIHVDIDPSVIGANFPAAVALVGDARRILPELRRRLESRELDTSDRRESVTARIAADKQSHRQEWLSADSERVNPLRFFEALRERLADDAVVAVDDGNHTFLAAELFPVTRPRCFISPTDFNAMGYCVPATVGAGLARPGRQAVGVVGDGAFLMSGMELLTASAKGVGVVIFVFNDGELSQIAQGQQIPYNRKTCTVLPQVRIEGIAQATGAGFRVMADNSAIGEIMDWAFEHARGATPAVVDVRIDYQKRTCFTQGVVKTVLKRFPTGDKLRFVGRALTRKLTG